MSQLPSTTQDRRLFKRSIVGMPIQAVRRAASPEDPRRLISLHLANMSRGGVGAVTCEQLAAGEPVTLFFPPLGPGKGRDAVGQVVRCLACGDHLAVGIAFESPWPEREEMRGM